MERKDIYNIIDGERFYQDLKWEQSNIENGCPDNEKPIDDVVIIKATEI